jgi:hypothetical protein
VDEQDPRNPPSPSDEEDPRDHLKLDPNAPPAERNADEPVAEDEPAKDQGDPLDRAR